MKTNIREGTGFMSDVAVSTADFPGGRTRVSMAVVGAGALGGVFAWAMHRAGHDVSVCVRSPLDELVVTTAAGEERVPVQIVTEPGRLRPVQWVLLAVKAFDTMGTAPWLTALCDENTTVLALQNGVDQAESVRELVPEATVVPAMVYVQAEREAPGHIRLAINQGIDIPAGRKAMQVRALFNGSGVDVRLQEDLTTAAWLKLMLNVATNSLTALTLRRMEVLQDDGVRELAVGLMREAAEVGVSAGAHLTEQDVQRTLDLASTYADGGTSMLHDRLAGSPLEHEALNGAVVRLAEVHGIDVPLNRAVAALLRALRPLDSVTTTAGRTDPCGPSDWPDHDTGNPAR
ncbi:2-dehydropantoate 2-reductase [Streptomyces sp. NPDC086077]|uniref:2-dehydropantoate 2-reductase n=1 Tax=Streptomyces sp. NPDC086077 TaxID=3154862 RepID=UPI00342C8CA0